MQKWCPEPFEIGETTVAIPAAGGDFQSDTPAANHAGNEAQSGFLSEAGFASPHGLLAHLTEQERDQLLELVEKDLTEKFQQREDDLRAELDLKVKEIEEAYKTNLGSLAQEIEETLGRQIKEMATASARLAVQIAEKIIRRTAALDPDVLVRVLETTQYKLRENTNLTVRLNPEEAAWLEAQPELLKKFSISGVQADRRVEKGGCIIKAGTQEWDATIDRQLESLSEIVEEAIALAGESGPALQNEESHAPEMG